MGAPVLMIRVLDDTITDGDGIGKQDGLIGIRANDLQAQLQSQKHIASRSWKSSGPMARKKECRLMHIMALSRRLA
jgi:hypothetical protein